MDKEGKLLLDDIFEFDTKEGGEEEEEVSTKGGETTTKTVDEILQKNIEERNHSNDNDKEYISKYNKDNLLAKKDIKTESISDENDLVEQLLKNSNKINEEENPKNKVKDKSNSINGQNKNKINIYSNKKKIKFPETFKNNPTPFDFIDFMERKYNKCVLDEEREKYFYLEKYQKEGKFKRVKCWKFSQKNSIMNHILKNPKQNYIPKQKNETKITCIVANNDLIYIGDSNGIIKIFSLKTEIEIGPLNYKPEELINISNKTENENISVTSMDVLSNKNLLVCGYYNGIVEIWDLEYKKCKKKLTTSITEHKSQILAVKFLNGNDKMMEIISSDCSGLVNITALTVGLFKNIKAEVNPLIEYSQPIFVIEILKFTKEEKKMPFLKKNIEIVGFACYDYVFIYQINPELVELFKFTRPDYFSDYNIANISFGIGYIPRTKDIIDINRDQNQKLNEKASEYCIDTKNINRLVAVSWDTFINIYAIKFDLENGVETIAMVGNYINSCQINRMFFVGDSILFIYDKKDKFKLLNTGMMNPGETVLDENNKIPLYEKEKEKRALIQELNNIIDKVLKQNYIPQSTKKTEKEIKTKETYYNSIYSNNKNIYILGENELEYGEIYSWEECVNKLINDSEWINALIFGLKLFKGEEYISYSGVPIDAKKRKEIVGEKMKKIIKEYIDDRIKVDKGHINENKYNEILTSCIYLSIEFCFEINSIDFLFKEIAPIYTQKKLEKFFYESLEPYIINGNIGQQILSENVLKKLVLSFIEKKQYQKLGQIIKNLYLSVADSEVVGNRTTQYDTIFTGLITYCSGEKNKDFMFPAREIYTYLQSAKQIPRELYWKIKTIDNKKYYYFDYENVVNNTDIDELILSYQYLGSLLLWYIYLCLEGYKFPSGKLIEDKKHEALIKQLFLWLINDEVLQRLIEFDSYSLFFIFKKFFMKKQKIIEKIEYSDLFKLIKIGDKELQEAKIQKYIEIIFRKASRIDKGKSSNIYVYDDLCDFLCTIATTIQIIEKCDSQNNYLLESIYHIINYQQNQKKEEEMEKEVIEQKGDNYINNTELKDKYDRYCLHLNRYKENNYIITLANIVIAAIDNNIEIFTKEDIENLLKKAEKTDLTRLKLYLAQKLENYAKCLDVYLNEYKGEEQIIILYNYINNELSKLKDDQKKYAKFKNDILSRVTEISSLSIDNLIDLTDKYFDENHALILFRIKSKVNKIKYLEEIIYKYKEDEISPSDPIAKEYIEILKLHIDLLCELKQFNKILPNLKKRYFYPVDYCLKKCKENHIIDASIYLERRRGNINEALKLINVFTKQEFNKFKNFLNSNYEEILKLEEEQKQNKNNINNNEYKYINESDDEEDNVFLYETDLDNEDNENDEDINNNENVLITKIKLNRKQNSILKLGIEICESASEKSAKKEAKENWSSLLKMYYELNKDVKSDMQNKELKIKVGDKLIKKLEYNITEIIEKMNIFFDLNTVLDLLSDIQGNSFGQEEFISHLKKLVFSGMSYNFILKSAESLLKENILNSRQSYKSILTHGKQFNFEKCDVCGKIFKETEKIPFIFFNCGHKCHFSCTVIINGQISCKLCKDYENIYEDTTYRENEDLEINDEEYMGFGRNRINAIKINSSISIENENNREKRKKIKLLNDVNKRYFENSKIFEEINI